MTKRLKDNEGLELSKSFYKLASNLGDYRFDHWDELTLKQRYNLEKKESQLRSASSVLNAKSVLKKIKLIQRDLQTLQSATKKMKTAAKKIKNIKHAIKIATKATIFGGAIAAGNVEIIISTASDLISEIDA